MLRFSKHGLRVALAAASLTASISVGLASSAQAATPPIGAFTTQGAWSFYSAPNLHPPKIGADAPTAGKKLAPGYLMLANFKNVTIPKPMVGEAGPMIFDNHLRPVWFDPIGVNALPTDLTVQRYNGKPALSWWQGVVTNTGATLSGEDVLVDQHYRTVATLTGDTKDGWVLSPHEVLISGHDAWVTAYRNVPMDLTAYHGLANGTLLDSAVQEYDLKTGRLISTWDALGHIPLSESQTHPAPVPGIPWDAFHVNSIQLLTSGGFLVSMRNTWGIYLVGADGSIKWTLGAGAAGNFALSTGATFHWQHDAQLGSGGMLTLFDDACCAITGPGVFGPPSGPSRGVELKLDTTKHTATLVAQFARGSNFNAAFLGSMQLLSNGNALVGWGSQPYFTEFSGSGKTLLDAVLPTPDLSYRALVQNWVGTPFFPPSGAARRVHGKTTVYASWDGATQVVSWRILAGRNAKHLTAVATRAKSGFETSVRLPRGYRSYKVQALDAKGHVLGTSGMFPKGKSGSGNPGFY